MKKVLLATVAAFTLMATYVPGVSSSTAYAQAKAKPQAADCGKISNTKKKAACIKAQSSKHKNKKGKKPAKKS